MDEKWTVSKERQEVIELLQDHCVDEPEYKNLVERLDALTKIEKIETETRIAQEKMERDANLAESRAKAELRLKEEELKVKKKEFWMGILKTVAVGCIGFGEMCALAYFDEIKGAFGKAWSKVMWPR